MFEFPDAEKLMQWHVSQAAPNAHVATSLSSKIYDKLPFVLTKRTPVLGGADPRFYDRAIMDIQVWSGSREEGYNISSAIRRRMLVAWDEQLVSPDGVNISFYVENSAPAEMPDGTLPDRVWRFQASYEIFFRSDKEI